MFSGSSKRNIVQSSSLPFLRWQDVTKYGMPLGKCSSGFGTKLYNIFVWSAGKYKKTPWMWTVATNTINISLRLQRVYDLWYSTGLFISPSRISELDCTTTKTDTAERSISIGRESLQVFFFVLRGLGILPGSTARG